VRSIDFPHLREEGGKWLRRSPGDEKDPEFSLDRLCYYGRQLRGLGMPDLDIAVMFGDLYWDAVTEYNLNQEQKVRSDGHPGASVPIVELKPLG
jgi:hypothetical protein